MASFTTRPISYTENRADGAFAWTVAFDLSFVDNEVFSSVDVRLVGANPGTLKGVWENGINNIWNNKVFFADGSRLYEVKIDVDFVTSGQHQTVTVHSGFGSWNLTNWYLSTSWGPDFNDELAAHEFGHMLGNFDAYTGGATLGGFITTGTLMSDLTVAGFQNYFGPIRSYTEQNSGKTFSTVLALTGTNTADTLVGNSAKNGIVGLTGADTLNGLGGNDLIDGGLGRDMMTGGSGKDYFDFDRAGETSNSASVCDVITDFSHLVDKIELSGMDASSAIAGNNSFVWRGGGAFNASSADGELRYQRYNNPGQDNDYTIIYGNTDRDQASEFQIRLDGLVTLSAADFVL